MKRILVTGGAGYVGARLVPALLKEGHFVRVLDLMLYGEDVFNDIENKDNLEVVKGDLRDLKAVSSSLDKIDTVIHLACISNDPSFELNPDLGKSINFDSFRPLVEAAKASGVDRFINASSSSVYGIKSESNVTEEASLEPLTDYSKFKAMCEEVLLEYASEDFTVVSVRPATVCGYSPRQRLDVIVNILTNHAVNNRKIKVFGGNQLRPNIHIDDMVDVYLLLLNADKNKIHKQTFNAGYENQTVMDLATMVKEVIGDDVDVEVVPTDDNRSYHISSLRIQKELNFTPKRNIHDAVKDLKVAFGDGKLENSFEDPRYFNIKTMIDAEIK